MCEYGAEVAGKSAQKWVPATRTHICTQFGIYRLLWYLVWLTMCRLTK